MIFGTVGTHTQGFDRLVIALDECASQTDEPLVVQTGASQHEPRHAEWFRFESPARIESLMREARVVVTHAGAGSLLMALECGTPVVAVPRLSSLGEHVDDHQLELCEALQGAGLIRVATDGASLRALLQTIDERPPMPAPGSRARLIASVQEAVASLSRKPA